MTTEPVRAGSEWLALREPADGAARARDLVEQVRARLGPDGGEVHDLGCGTGSMLRWLAPRLAGPQRWVLYDRDGELLEVAAGRPPGRSADGAAVTVRTRRADITRIDPEQLRGAALVTASALLDMLTGEELDRLVATCTAPGCAVLITLSVTGGVELEPADPFDLRVRSAFNDHQRRATGNGRLLGPDAAAAAVEAFTGRGRDVLVRDSPWRLGPEQRGLAAEWFEGWLSAACEQDPGLLTAAAPYARRRRGEIDSGRLSVTVHHEDLLVLPA